ncbi:MAG: sensor histidine kinase [bacterium]
MNKTLMQLLNESDGQIQKLQAQLIQAGKLAALGTQGAIIAHELNNPLTIISAEADELLDGFDERFLDEKLVQKSARNIKNSAQRMRAIIDHIRQYTRNDSNANWTQINVNETIRDSLILFNGQLQKAGIEVKLLFTADLPKIWGQQNKLESVFQNLIANANEAFKSVKDGRQKQMTISTLIDCQNTVKIIFSDNANGMSRKTQQSAFEPFFTTKARNKGTGLGLFIVQSIVHEFQGQIHLHSIKGQGTKFTMTFPTERRKTETESKGNENDISHKKNFNCR